MTLVLTLNALNIYIILFISINILSPKFFLNCDMHIYSTILKHCSVPSDTAAVLSCTLDAARPPHISTTFDMRSVVPAGPRALTW